MGDSDRKVYCGGLAPESTQESLEQHFSKYGDVEDVVIMMEKATNRSRGFGFVTFKSPSSVAAAVGASHNVDGRDISVKKAVRDASKSGGGGDRQPSGDSGDSFNVVKIFVGGLPATCDYEKLTEYFTTYGAIKDAVVMMDAQTQRHRGFGYVTFEDTSSVEAALKNYSENKIDGKWVEVKRCIPQDAIRGSDRGGGKKGGSDGRGGGDRRKDDQLQPQGMSPYQGAPPAYGAPPPGYPGYAQGPPPPGYPGADPYAAWYASQGHYPPPQYGYSPYGYGHYPPPPHHDPYGGAYGGYPPYGGYGPPPSSGTAVPTQRYDSPAPEGDSSGRESRRDRQRSVPY